MAQIRKKINLHHGAYIGMHAYSITICTFNRRKIFTNFEVINYLISLLRKSMELDFDVHIFTFMPDHLHLLVSGKTEFSDLRHVLKKFKQLSGYWYKQLFKITLWQKRYFDHALRSEEALEDVAWYILNNPVRDGLTDNPFTYPFSGSFVYKDLHIIDPQSKNK